MPSVRRWFFRALAAESVIIIISAAIIVPQVWRPIGQGAVGTRAARMAGSSQFAAGKFTNPQPLYNDIAGSLTTWMAASDHPVPKQPIKVQKPVLDTPPTSGLRVTWLGHSTVLIEIEGKVFLTDPVWGRRSSPLSWLGPERWYDPPIALDALPKLDAVLISHDHYDHLDYPTIVALRAYETRFICPLGVGAHLQYWGVPEDRITEVDWWDTVSFEHLELVAVPARHASGRQVFDQNATLWAGYALIGRERRVLFSGDTGLFTAMKEIGARLGPFDLTMIEVGAYSRSWPDWHIGPEQAVLGHQWMRGRVLLPIHWGLFNLATHGWTEPIERVLAAARTASVAVVTPRPGGSFEPTRPPAVDRWWPDVPWQSAAEHPVRSTVNGDPAVRMIAGPQATPPPPADGPG